MKYGLIGEHLPHSFSKIIHEKLGNKEYELKELTKDEVDDYIESREFKGINVTIPYKQTVIPHLDEMSSAAKRIGAVNTIVNKDGKLYGDNTDYGGMSMLIKKLGIDITGKKVLILGTGGTSLTASFVACDMGASKIYRVSRSAGKDTLVIDESITVETITYDDVYQNHLDAGIIINTTPAGMYPEIDKTPIDIDRFEKLTGVVDAIYNPLRSQLVLQAQKKNIPAGGGLYMLVAQAVIASKQFLETDYDQSVYDNVYKELLASKENIVLTGMPSCGKTTIGTYIAEKTGRELIDTDQLIVEKAGKPITEIFEEVGEQGFRDMESQVIKDIRFMNNAVISTGGGAILRPENIMNLKANGRVYFIERELEKLLATDDRPLSSSVEAVKKRYEERIDIYLSTADEKIDNNGDELDYEYLGNKWS